MMPSSSQDHITLEGHLERITFYNPENHYTIARLRVGKIENPTTVVGHMPGVNPGDTLKIRGHWETHTRYGQQFKVAQFEVRLPRSVEGIRKYLDSGFIKGVGPVIINRIIHRFGKRSLEIIETRPERLLEVKGIGRKIFKRLLRAWNEHHSVRYFIRFLQENGISTTYCARILKEYGSEAVEIISKDPYRIVRDIPSIGFYVADAIALNRGLQRDDPKRVQACVYHQVGQFAHEGHTFVHEDKLVESCAGNFEIPEYRLAEAVGDLVDADELVVENAPGDPRRRAVFLKSLHQAEETIASRLDAMLTVSVSEPALSEHQITLEILRKLAIKLSYEQMAVLDGILQHPVAVVTGGPGTGKTTLIRSITAICEAMGKRILLAAPTGRAAKRLSEVTGKKARTIHRLLGYSFRDDFFEHHRDNPLDADAVIIDEASMVDVVLMYHLVNAVHMTCKLILVGDVFQLPPVGPGTVLHDMIRSRKIKTFELTQIFRQAAQSAIVVNAHKVRNGESLTLKGTDYSGRLSEFYFIQQGNPKSVVQTIVELCQSRIPQSFDMHPVADIQVLTPMHKGDVGTLNLNRVLQRVLNTRSGDRVGGYQPGDKVMHLRNNYQKDVFNGDIGTIHLTDKVRNCLAVDYEDKVVEYDAAELNELSLAYAISVHKSQGSEYPAVVVPILTQHYPLLQRNLLYTAITRAKHLVILIGTTKAVQIALDNDKPRSRLTSLSAKLSLNGA